MAIQVAFDRMLKVYFKIFHNYCLSNFDIKHKGKNNFEDKAYYSSGFPTVISKFVFLKRSYLLSQIC